MTPRKKFGSGKIIATILGIFVLVGGVTAGVLLTQQSQIFKQKAVSNSSLCPQAEGCPISGQPGTLSSCHPPQSDGTADLSTCNRAGRTAACGDESGSDLKCFICRTAGGNWTVLNDGACPTATPSTSPSSSPSATASPTATPTGSPNPSGSSTGTPTATPTTTPTASPPPGALECLSIKAYNTSWNVLSDSDLSNLLTGTQIQLCVQASGSPDEAQFNINGTLEPITTTVRPGSTDFCQSYTIQSSDTTVSVKAKIHYAGQGWFGENI